MLSAQTTIPHVQSSQTANSVKKTTTVAVQSNSVCVKYLVVPWFKNITDPAFSPLVPNDAAPNAIRVTVDRTKLSYSGKLGQHLYMHMYLPHLSQRPSSSVQLVRSMHVPSTPDLTD